jgi:DNA-binding NarL/FixJ family response regulator
VCRSAVTHRSLVHVSDVVWLSAQGQSSKYVAYELGLSAATVQRRLTKAMRKLRVSSRRDLLRKLGTPKH